MLRVMVLSIGNLHRSSVEFSGLMARVAPSMPPNGLDLFTAIWSDVWRPFVASKLSVAELMNKIENGLD